MNANLYSLFERHFAGAAEEPCLLIPHGPVIRYGDLHALSARIANALTRAGCRPGDRVAA
jgi:acyl-coenzyme A synthetase/AMP-(fatty) acid ligase